MKTFQIGLDEAQHAIRDRYALVPAAIIIALVGLFSIELYVFARAQDVWSDKSTQLSGITLSPWEMLRWLLGLDADRFGVPLDRMPPVGYLIDWLWLRLAGSAELGFRLFHSAFVVAGVAMLAFAAFRRMSAWAATVVVAFCIFSPKLLATAVEIRPYPIFFAVTCAQIVVFLRLASKPNNLNLTMLAVFVFLCLISEYTHFYGLVSSCAFFLALGSAFFRSRSSLIAVMAAFLIVVAGSLGIFPFAFDSIGLTKKITDVAPLSGNEISTGEYLRHLLSFLEFLFGLLGSNANMIFVSGYLLFIGGAVALLSAAAVGAFVNLWNGRPRPFDWLALTVIAGAAAPVVAVIVVKIFHVKIFDPTVARYSGWLFAPLAVMIASGAISLTGFRLWDRWGRFAAIGAMLIGAASATQMFFTHASMFVHGPQRLVGEIYDGIPGSKAIIYKDGDQWWLFSYFPLVFTHKGEIAQYRATTDGGALVQMGGGADSQRSARDVASTVAPYNHLLVVDVQLRTVRDMRECLYRTDRCPSFAQGSVETILVRSGRWEEATEVRFFGEYDTQVKMLERVGGKEVSD